VSVPRLAPVEACTTVPHARSLGSSHPLALQTLEAKKEEVFGKTSKKKEGCPRAALLADVASCACVLLPPQHPPSVGAARETGKRRGGTGLRRRKTAGTERRVVRSRERMRETSKRNQRKILDSDRTDEGARF
jgi:hypothetical protein